jgi:hypothetical protein
MLRRVRGRDRISPFRALGRRQEDQPYGWSPQISALEMPTLNIVGDADSVILEQSVSCSGCWVAGCSRTEQSDCE